MMTDAEILTALALNAVQKCEVDKLEKCTRDSSGLEKVYGIREN